VEKYFRGGAGGRWQYGASALLAGYLRLQIHKLTLCNNHCFPLQNWLQERASMLRYTYFAVLLLTVFVYLVQHSPDSSSPEGSRYCFFQADALQARSRLYWVQKSVAANTECNRRNGPDFGRVFLMLNYTEKPQNIYIQSSMVTEI